jgi:hypothetical protein
LAGGWASYAGPLPCVQEYRRLVALTDEDRAGRIPGWGEGTASFNAEATAGGHPVASCD